MGRTVFRVVLMAGWIPAFALMIFAQGPTPVKVTRLYTGADGKTKVEEYEVNKDYDLDWHPAPNRQFVVTLSGESEIELEGGRKLRLGPGHILLAEDTTGQGHISRAIGSGDRISLFIPLADGAVPPR